MAKNITPQEKNFSLIVLELMLQLATMLMLENSCKFFLLVSLWV